jgi:formylmethanofuran dehydrogenase subunit B
MGAALRRRSAPPLRIRAATAHVLSAADSCAIARASAIWRKNIQRKRRTHPEGLRVMAAFIGKTEVPVEAAASRARELLGAWRMPLVAGLGADVAGMRGALRVAAALGASVDFCRAPGSTHLLRAVIDRGLMFTTPREARIRADVLLMIGPSIAGSEAIIDILQGQPVLSAGDGAKRDVLWLCPASGEGALTGFDLPVVDAEIGAIHGILALLSAAMRSRPLAIDRFGGLFRQDYEEIAGRLITARFGVLAFAPEDLDALAIEALLAFAEKLGAATRVTLLPLIGDAGAQTAAMVSTWTTGFPPRLGFARGYPEFDLWRFDAARLSQSGECDGLLWLSPLAAKGPDWTADMPTIAITQLGTVFARAPEVLIETALPGADAPSELFSPRHQTLVSTPALPGAAHPSPAVVLDMLLGQREARAA